MQHRCHRAGVVQMKGHLREVFIERGWGPLCGYEAFLYTTTTLLNFQCRNRYLTPPNYTHPTPYFPIRKHT